MENLMPLEIQTQKAVTGGHFYLDCDQNMETGAKAC